MVNQLIELNYTGWMIWLAVAALATGAGWLVSRLLPWSGAARAAGLPASSGAGLGLLLAAMATILALGIFPGASHRFHLAVVAAALAAIALGAAVAGRNGPQVAGLSGISRPVVPHRVWQGLIFAFGFVMLAASIATPLAQNDALEYATIARVLFDHRDILSVPVLDPTANAYGAYYPWTHPPAYVSLVYLAYAAQGHADAPGLMRLIAPWGLICCTWITYTVASLIDRRVAAAAALMVMAAPLLFLGATAALIDSLPVMALILAVSFVVGMNGEWWRRALLTGGIIGLGLWTHSESVLILPLVAACIFCRRGLFDLRGAAKEVAVALFAALVVGLWPYLRNFVLFGSIISDNPPVFRIPGQYWNEYFSVMRGVGTLPSRIQYGLLKGWFAPEAFGLAYWLLLPALAGIAVAYGRRWREALAGDGIRADLAVVWLCMVVVACYHLGVLFTIVLGEDTLIKNERYALLALPAVAILAGCLFREPLDGGATRRYAGRLVAGAFTAAMALLLVAVTWMAIPPRLIAASNLGAPVEEALRSQPEFRAIFTLRQKSTSGAVVLSFKPADMYYAGRPMISCLDPRLIGFYEAGDSEQALRHLRSLGVTHILVPDYGLPPVLNRNVNSILGDPAKATLLEGASGNQLYALRPSGLVPGAEVEIAAGPAPWTQTSNIVLGGRKAVFTLPVSRAMLAANHESRARPLAGLFERDRSITLGSAAMPVSPGREYRLQYRVAGRGAVKLRLKYTNSGGLGSDPSFPLGPDKRIALTDFYLTDDQPSRDLQIRFASVAGFDQVQVEFEHLGDSWLRVESASITPLEPSGVSADAVTARFRK